MRASASTEKSQRQALGPMARKEMRPLETARTTRYKVPNSATSIFGRQKLEKPTFQWGATETETVSVPVFSGGPLKKGEFGRRNRSKRRGTAAEDPPRRTKEAQRSHPLQVHYVLRGPIRRDPAHLFSSAWQAGESKRADRKRRRLYFYSRSAISRSAAHLRNGGDTSVTVVTSNICVVWVCFVPFVLFSSLFIYNWNHTVPFSQRKRVENCIVCQ